MRSDELCETSNARGYSYLNRRSTAKNLFISFAIPIAVALIIGLSFFSRQLIGVAISGERYTPLVYNSASLSTQTSITPNYNFKPDDILWDETRAYARYTQEILRKEFLGANGSSFNSYLKEGSFPENYWYRDRLGPAILALMATALGGAVSNAFLAADFVFPFCIALGLIILCRNFFKFTFNFSIMATASVMWLNWNDLLHLRDIIYSGELPDGAMFLRTPYPQLSFLTFVFFVTALMNFHRNPSRLALLFLSVTLLINFYTYFYVWTLVFVMAFLYVIINSHKTLSLAFINTEPRNKKLLWGMIAIVTLLSFPVWGMLLQGGDEFKDSFLRVFGSYTHLPWRNSFLMIPFLMISLCINKKSWSTRWIWIIFFSASLIVLNQQVITGKLNQPSHWTGGIIEPFIILFLFDLALLVKNKFSKKTFSLISILLILTIFVQIYCVSYDGAKAATAYNRVDPQFSELLTFMNKPTLLTYGFITNDPYLKIILPAYLIQKPMMPWYNDPLSNKNLSIIYSALADQYQSIVGSRVLSYAVDGHHPKIKFNKNKILFILNRHLINESSSTQYQLLFKNENFIVGIQKT